MNNSPELYRNAQIRFNMGGFEPKLPMVNSGAAKTALAIRQVGR